MSNFQAAQIINGETKIVHASQIEQHPENPRNGDIDEIRNSIRYHGFYGHLGVQLSSNFIIIGNHRYEAGVLEGMSEFPVIYLDVDDDEALRIMLNDNRSSDVAGYHDDHLLRLLKDTQNTAASLAGTGFDDEHLRQLMNKEMKDHPNLEEPTTTKFVTTCPNCGHEFTK